MSNDSSTAKPAAVTRQAGRRPGLTRDQVLTAAMAIVDEGGVDDLTMRRLGQALDRNPMAVYRHAMDKDILLDGAGGTRDFRVCRPASGQPRHRSRLGGRIAGIRPPVPSSRPGPPEDRADVGHPITVRPVGSAAPGDAPTVGRTPRTVSPTPDSTSAARCTPPGCTPATSTSIFSMRSRNRSTTPTRLTMCSASACTVWPSPNSPDSAHSPPSSPLTTGQPNSTKDSAS